jgi:hypothetical protein
MLQFSKANLMPIIFTNWMHLSIRLSMALQPFVGLWPQNDINAMLNSVYQMEINWREIERNRKILRYDMICNQLNSNLFHYLITNFILIYTNFLYITKESFFSFHSCLFFNIFHYRKIKKNIFRIRSSHRSEYEEYSFLRCGGTQSDKSSPTLRRNIILPLSSGRALTAICSFW